MIIFESIIDINWKDLSLIKGISPIIGSEHER